MAAIEVDPKKFVKRHQMTPKEWQENHPGEEKDWGFKIRYANSPRHLGLFHVHATWERAEGKALDIAERYMAHLVVEVLF